MTSVRPRSGLSALWIWVGLSLLLCASMPLSASAAAAVAEVPRPDVSPPGRDAFFADIGIRVKGQKKQLSWATTSTATSTP